MMKHIVSFFICFVLLASCSAAEKKEMKASDVIKLLKNGKHIHFHDKIITDDLCFANAAEPFLISANTLQSEIGGNIFFSNCIFLGKVTSTQKVGQTTARSAFRNNLIFIDCDFRGEVDFAEATVNGIVNFSKSTFHENATFNGMAVWAKDSYFSEIKAEKRFSAVYSQFMGNLHIIAAEFADRVSFQETSVKGKFVLNNSHFSSRAAFDMMETNGSAFFNYVAFADNVNFSNARFMNSVDFIKTIFGKTPTFDNAYFLSAIRVETANPDALAPDFTNAFLMFK
ncbi:MAG: pentapeptide repeat-containing protein [Cytophagaceae bacterium]|jgi:hypothetical protein|nr:pentapeptide repeat-containing protein [Cytophagaceae bacterium]